MTAQEPIGTKAVFVKILPLVDFNFYIQDISNFQKYQYFSIFALN